MNNQMPFNEIHLALIQSYWRIGKYAAFHAISLILTNKSRIEKPVQFVRSNVDLSVGAKSQSYI